MTTNETQKEEVMESDARIEWLKSVNNDGSQPHEFLQSLYQSLLKKGSLSERQLIALGKWYASAKVREARNADRAASLAASGPLETGRREVVGTIVSTRWQTDGYSYYGRTTLKCLIEQADGNRVWGTVPRDIEDRVDKGTVVSLVATVKRSDKDEHFGFYSRPSKPVILEGEVVAEEPEPVEAPAPAPAPEPGTTSGYKADPRGMTDEEVERWAGEFRTMDCMDEFNWLNRCSAEWASRQAAKEGSWVEPADAPEADLQF